MRDQSSWLYNNWCPSTLKKKNYCRLVYWSKFWSPSLKVFSFFASKTSGPWLHQCQVTCQWSTSKPVVSLHDQLFRLSTSGCIHREHMRWTNTCNRTRWPWKCCVWETDPVWKDFGCEPSFFGEKLAIFWSLKFSRRIKRWSIFAGDMSQQPMAQHHQWVAPTWGALCASHWKHWIAWEAPILWQAQQQGPLLCTAFERWTQRITIYSFTTEVMIPFF